MKQKEQMASSSLGLTASLRKKQLAFFGLGLTVSLLILFTLAVKILPPFFLLFAVASCIGIVISGLLILRER